MIDRTIFFYELSKALGPFNASQKSGCGTILDSWAKVSATADLRFVACSLGTTYHETDKTMQPIEEYGKGRGRAYGVPVGPWRKIYDGRGDVQMTWESNYRFATGRLRALGFIGANDDLERNPELAMRPDIAAAILIFGMIEGWFTGHKLGDYFNSTITAFIASRRIVNGTDRAATVAGYCVAFYKALRAAYAALVPPPAILPPVAPGPSGANPYPFQSVRWTQWMLNQLGINPQLGVDGDPGPLTRARLIAFQTTHGLVGDASVGPLTAAALIAAAALH